MENPEARIDSLKDRVNSTLPRRLRVAAIRFLNPAPLMWDFEHPPLNAELAERYEIKWMLPSQCADELADGSADIRPTHLARLHNRLEGQGAITSAGAPRKSAAFGPAKRCGGFGKPHHIGLCAHPLPQIEQRRSALHFNDR